ncbi:MAG: metallophosphoesterase [Acidimicrobiales bacterium]
MIDDSGYVWWGWWAKAWERIPTSDEWQQISTHVEGRPEIGLFDRRSLRYYLAVATDLRRSTDSDARIPSPEPSATPHYYSDDYFPVWFRLESIRETSEVEFRSTFGFVPMAEDQTLFWEDSSDPPEQDLVEVIRTASSSVLHISDLHFGEDFGFSGSESPYGQSTLDQIIARYLRDARTDIGVVVVSGDLITRGMERHYRDVTAFLDLLLSQLGLSRNHVVVVPGNHDLWLDDASNFTYSHDYKHELGYRTWYGQFFNESDANLKLERVKLYDCADGMSLGFLQVNSARLRERETMEFGFVGSHRYIELLKVLSEIERDRICRMFVLHHHLIPVPGTEGFGSGRPISVTVDSGRIIEDLQRYGIDLVLHGHQHLPFLGSVSRRSLNEYGLADGHLYHLYVLGAGSAGAKADRLTPELRVNAFGLYSFVGDEMTAVFVEITPGGNARRTGEARIPVRGLMALPSDG